MQLGGFILAAGEGRRLRPATLLRPKALVPMCGIPMLELVASSLMEAGLKQLVVNACFQGDRIHEFCLELSRRRHWDLRVSREQELLNQGGGLRKGVTLLPECDTFLVHNVDIVLDYDLKQLIAAHRASQAKLTVLLIPGKGPRTVSLKPDGSILRFRDPRHGTHTFSCIYIFHRSLLQYLDDAPAPDIIIAFQRALDAGEPVQAVTAPDGTYWSDFGTPADYIRAHEEIADLALAHHAMLRQAQAIQAARRFALEQKGVHCSGALGLGRDLAIPAGARLHNVVLWDYTRLPRPLLYADGIYTGSDAFPPTGPIPPDRMPDARVFEILGTTPEQCVMEDLPKQGSGRRYRRLRIGSQSYVWCAYNQERQENAGFAAISSFLARIGIRVPAVRVHLADAGELVTDDLGQNDLLLSPAQMKEGLLCQAICQIARLHVIGDRQARQEELPLQPGFTRGLYNWERDYFRENMLDAVLHIPQAWAPAALEYNAMRARLLSEPLVPLHRDFQSANLMVKDNEVYFIDFQGMRPGCAAYDLGSLLYDPYQCLPGDMRLRLWRKYQKEVTALGGIPPSDKVFHIAAAQRLMQALGAYGKLWRKDGLEWYRQFILPGFQMLREATAPEHADLPALHGIAAQAILQWNSL